MQGGTFVGLSRRSPKTIPAPAIPPAFRREGWGAYDFVSNWEAQARQVI